MNRYEHYHDLKVEVAQARAGHPGPVVPDPRLAQRLSQVAARIEGIASGLERE